ncbi:conserved hypothetical protein [Pseudomonas sp. 8AS]|nr:conserved hypothetical protein [Pseudomonas sp. 8AS]
MHWRKKARLSRAGVLQQALSEPVCDLLIVGHAALKSGSECSFTARKFRFLAQFRLAWL